MARNTSDVLLYDDLRAFLRRRYQNDGITAIEIETAIAQITVTEGSTLYEDNAHTLRLLMDGFSIKREDNNRPNLFINPIYSSTLHAVLQLAPPAPPAVLSLCAVERLGAGKRKIFFFLPCLKKMVFIIPCKSCIYWLNLGVLPGHLRKRRFVFFARLIHLPPYPSRFSEN